MEGDREARLTDAGERAAATGIISAGVAGTVLAIALKQSGLDVELYDAPGRTPLDRAIWLSANGTRVLHAIGLKEAVAEAALFPQFTTIRHARTSFLLSQRPLGAFSEARYGAPDLLIGERALIALLLRAAEEQGIPSHPGTAIEAVDAGGATLQLADGRRLGHQALAVDGGRPTDTAMPGLANLLEERHWEVPADYIVLRVQGPRAEPSREHARFVNCWVADGLIALEQPLPGEDVEQRVSLTLIAPPPPAPDEPAVLARTLLARCHPYLQNLFDEAEHDLVRLPAAPPAEFWHSEKLALLGEACHGHPVFPELAVAAGLEDAWVLSRMMERWEESPHKGYPDYERYRKPRARRLRAHADAERASLATADSLQVWQRNLKWSLTSRFLPEIAMQRTDWLYGYDCIKGFV